MKTLNLIPLCGAVMLMGACASLVSKSNWPLYIGSNPAGASIAITNKAGMVVYQGKTPAAVKLKSSAGYFSREAYVLTISSPGHKTQTIPVGCKVNGWYAGNILIGGLVGLLIVDPATGAMYKLETDAISCALSAEEQTMEAAFILKTIDQVPVDARTGLKLVQP